MSFVVGEVVVVVVKPIYWAMANGSHIDTLLQSTTVELRCRVFYIIDSYVTIETEIGFVIRAIGVIRDG